MTNVELNVVRRRIREQLAMVPGGSWTLAEAKRVEEMFESIVQDRVREAEQLSGGSCTVIPMRRPQARKGTCR